MDNYKKISCFFVFAIFSLTFATLPLRHIPLFSYDILTFNYNFLGLETTVGLDSLFIFEHISKLALPIAAYLLVVNVNRTKDFKKVATYIGALAIFTQVLILLVNISDSQYWIDTSTDLVVFDVHSPLVRFFRRGNFFLILFLGVISIATYEKLKTKQRQAYAFIPFAIAIVVSMILNLIPILYPSLGFEQVMIGNAIVSSSLYMYVVELLTLPLFVIGIILTNLVINRLPDVDAIENVKSKKIWNILMPALIILMYHIVLPSAFLGYILILCLHIAIKNGFGHIKTLAIIMSAYYFIEILLLFAFARPEFMPSVVAQLFLLTVPSMFFSMLGIVLLYIFSITDEQLETNYITNIISGSIYPITILGVYLIFIV